MEELGWAPTKSGEKRSAKQRGGYRFHRKGSVLNTKKALRLGGGWPCGIDEGGAKGLDEEGGKGKEGPFGKTFIEGTKDQNLAEGAGNNSENKVLLSTEKQKKVEKK